jgi:hypothetical protein
MTRIYGCYLRVLATVPLFCSSFPQQDVTCLIDVLPRSARLTRPRTATSGAQERHSAHSADETSHSELFQILIYHLGIGRTSIRSGPIDVGLKSIRSGMIRIVIKIADACFLTILSNQHQQTLGRNLERSRVATLKPSLRKTFRVSLKTYLSMEVPTSPLSILFSETSERLKKPPALLSHLRKTWWRRFAALLAFPPSQIHHSEP